MDIQKSLKQNSWKYSVSELPHSVGFPMVDIIKFICSFLIISMHADPFLSFSERVIKAGNIFLLHGFVSLAVPFFFCCAGFFLFRKLDFDNYDTETIKSYVFRLLRLAGFWVLITPHSFNRHLWFMLALSLAVLYLTALIRRKVSLKKMAILALILYGFGLLGDSYRFLLEPLDSVPVVGDIIREYYRIFLTTRNSLFMGFPFVFMGLVFAKRKIVLSKGLAIGGLLVTLPCMFLEAALVPSVSDLCLTVVPTVFFLFYAATHIRLPSKPIYKKIRITGTLIYYSHMLMYFLTGLGLDFLANLFGVNIRNSLLDYLITCALAFLFSWMVEWLSRKEKFAFLKYIYS